MIPYQNRNMWKKRNQKLQLLSAGVLLLNADVYGKKKGMSRRGWA